MERVGFFRNVKERMRFCFRICKVAGPSLQNVGERIEKLHKIIYLWRVEQERNETYRIGLLCSVSLEGYPGA